MRSAFLIACLLAVAVLSSCEQDFQYQEIKDIENEKWPQGKEFSFVVEPQNPDTTLDLGLILRHDLDYPYENLYVKFKIYDSIGTPQDSMLYNIPILQSTTGKPFGQKQLGFGSNLFTHQILLSKRVSFKGPSPHTISFEQYMRVDTLPGMFSIGYFAYDHVREDWEDEEGLIETKKKSW